MSRTITKLSFIGLLAVGALIASTSEANAFWGYRGCSYPCASPVSYYSCYTPCYTTSCYTACCNPCDSWTLGVRPGPVRRWAFGPYRWYNTCNYCYSGCKLCYNPCSTWCNTCCTVTTSGSSCCQPAGNTTPTTAPNPTPDNQPTKAAPNPDDTPNGTNILQPISVHPTYENSALLTVWAPAKTKITINGYETTTKGSRRRFVSTGLKSGLTYRYEVRAELPRDGQMAEETKVVYLTAGSTEGVAFGFNVKPVDALAAAQ